MEKEMSSRARLMASRDIENDEMTLEIQEWYFELMILNPVTDPDIAPDIDPDPDFES